MTSAKSTFVILILLLFVGISVWGLGMSMMTDAQGHMSNCPLMNGSQSICTMNVFDHLANWQNLFVTVAPTAFNLSLILLISLTLILSAFVIYSPSIRENQSQSFSNFHAEFSAFFNPLRIAFSNGILHPKIYDIAVIR